MVTYARKPQQIDHQKTRRWALASLGSVGAGPVGVQLFDLLNLKTGRAHRLELKTGGAGLSLPVTGSVGSSDYSDFSTPRDVNFLDFNGTHMTVRETNALLYSWTTVSFWGMSVKIADGGLNVPGLGVSHGVAKILFSDGRPVAGSYQLVPDLDLRSSEPIAQRSVEVAYEEGAGIRVPGDILFAFNKYRLRPGRQTDYVLHDLVRGMAWGPNERYLIEGHTDSVGGEAYNKTLGKRRAETVAAWIRANYPHFGPQLKTEGIGEERPIASNSTEAGRAKNRRVEAWTLPKKIWDDY